MEKRILIVTDDNEQGTNLSEALKSRGYYTCLAYSGREAIDLAMNDKYDVVLLEQRMPAISGTKVLIELRKFKPDTKVIFITGAATINNAVEAIKTGASDYILSPFIKEELDATIRRCLEEAKFDVGEKNLDLDSVISSLSNPIRRQILKLLCRKKGMNLMEITRTLDMKKHTRLLFHLKKLQDSDLIGHDRKKAYFLTKEGGRTFNCLRILEDNHSTRTQEKNGPKTERRV
jgi:DNA-binding response OmpR family regulator